MIITPGWRVKFTCFSLFLFCSHSMLGYLRILHYCRRLRAKLWQNQVHGRILLLWLAKPVQAHCFHISQEPKLVNLVIPRLPRMLLHHHFPCQFIGKDTMDHQTIYLRLLFNLHPLHLRLWRGQTESGLLKLTVLQPWDQLLHLNLLLIGRHQLLPVI